MTNSAKERLEQINAYKRPLFCGKSLKDNTWVYGDLLTDLVDAQTAIRVPNVNENNSADIVPVNPQTVSQYTYIDDSYGKMIFEGSIVDLIYIHYFTPNQDKTHLIGVVYYDIKKGAYRVAYGTNLKETDSIEDGYWDIIKVIGNFYDDKNKFL